jgi:hypothetical protein
VQSAAQCLVKGGQQGFRGKVSRSTLADANESHDWRIFAEFAQVLFGIAPCV